MKTRLIACAALGAVGAVALAVSGRFSQPEPQQPASEPIAAALPTANHPAEKGREADDAAIRKTAQDFTAAFNKGDAGAVSAHWTEQGECQDAGGEVIRGRAAIEKTYADFFKDNPGAKIEVRIEFVRFHSPDTAVEDGILRLDRGNGELPTSTVYTTTHVRTDGQWRMAFSKEWGAGVDRIEDVDWLVGTWKAGGGDQEVTLTFTRETDNALQGRFTRQSQGKTATTGTMRIAFDPQAGQLRSWHFDADGGHGVALWARDGQNWVLDSFGVQAGGADTASVNILRRTGANEITWRSIDRVAADKKQPDALPTRFVRGPTGK